MPSFRQYDVPVEAEVEVNIDVEVDEFLDECDEHDIDNIIEYLKDKDYLKNAKILRDNQVCVAESEFMDALDKIYSKWNVLSNEETELIINISKRF